MINPFEKYTGPGAADPNKSRADREQELNRMADTEGGLEVLLFLYNEATGTPQGVSRPGTMVRLEMIPAILRHEYRE